MHYIYMVKCADETLYTGYATDVLRRLKEHNHSKKGAKYTRTRRPVHLVYMESFESRSEACKREVEIKKLKRQDKLDLIEGFIKSKGLNQG